MVNFDTPSATNGSVNLMVIEWRVKWIEANGYSAMLAARQAGYCGA